MREFGGLEPRRDLHPHYSLSTSTLQIGAATIQRRSVVLAPPLSSSAPDSRLHLLHHQLNPLESLVRVVNMHWMAILVGGAASGKTSLVRLLAQLTGHVLREFAMNSAVDTTGTLVHATLHHLIPVVWC